MCEKDCTTGNEPSRMKALLKQSLSIDAISYIDQGLTSVSKSLDYSRYNQAFAEVKMLRAFISSLKMD